jgi:hypothetical protein
MMMMIHKYFNQPDCSAGWKMNPNEESLIFIAGQNAAVSNFQSTVRSLVPEGLLS